MSRPKREPIFEGDEMSRAFTHYWAGTTVETETEGKLLNHTAGEGLRRSGVRAGDTIYVVNIRQGELYLLGRMEVGKYADSIQEVIDLIGGEPWPASDHLLALPRTATRFSRRRRVADAIVELLKFHTSKGDRGLAFLPDGKLDRQTLRGIRRLTRPSADLLDGVLDKA